MNKQPEKSPSALGTAAAIAGAAVAGVAVGAAAVVMSDPKKVKKLKSQVNKGVNKFVAESKDTIEDWKKEGHKLVSEVESKVTETKKDLSKKLKSR